MAVQGEDKREQYEHEYFTPEDMQKAISEKARKRTEPDGILEGLEVGWIVGFAVGFAVVGYPVGGCTL